MNHLYSQFGCKYMKNGVITHNICAFFLKNSPNCPLDKSNLFKFRKCSTSLGVKELKELSLRLGVKPNDMLVSFSWQGYLDFSLFTLHFSLQQLTWYRLNYLTTDYLTTSESRVYIIKDNLP
jgi:hypothetical protein